MKKILFKIKQARKFFAAISVMILSVLSTHSAMAISLSQGPLFLSKSVKPIVMLNMSSDHQLFYSAYDDYSDLNGDGIVDTGYIHDHKYYGYFNSELCYSYNSDVFEPKMAAQANDFTCDGSSWSGNFLNWATMTRMDAVRKILYGGYRSTDFENKTILERAFIPSDAHSFAKYYNGSLLKELTPLNFSTGEDTKFSGVTICNTTHYTNQKSQDVTAAPLMRVAKGNYSLWASNEGAQCRWGEGENANDPSITEIQAHGSSPSAAKGNKNLGNKDYNVRVLACSPLAGADGGSEKCKNYGVGSLKPTGLLQRFGEDDAILFGLMTGSYAKRKSGGALRKIVSEFSGEVNDNGTFNKSVKGGSIVDVIDKLRIANHNPNSNGYVSADNCTYGLGSFSNGQCTNWGNPQSEIYLESLRYLAGTASPNFATNDESYISGLKSVTWNTPITEENACAPLSILQFNASTSSYDHSTDGTLGELSGFSDISSTGVGESLNALTKEVGEDDKGTYMVGAVVGGNENELCTPKTVNDLSKVYGTCPDAPRLEGGYQIAGLAYHARKYGIPNSTEKVRTFGVSLAPAVPKLEVSTSKGVVTILPACRSNKSKGNCAIVDFKLVKEEVVGGVTKGQAYVNWEDSEQGGDYDQDMWGMLYYEVDGDKITMSSRVMAVSTDHPLGFGYVISGVTNAGFYVDSGVNNFQYPESGSGDSCKVLDWRNGKKQTSCRCKNSTESFGVEWNSGGTEKCDYGLSGTRDFTITGDNSSLMKQPLEYAALWGGYPDKNKEEEKLLKPEPGSANETYLPATNPEELERRLEAALTKIAEDLGSAASVAANSTRLGTDNFVFQAAFDTQNWSGDLKAFAISRSKDRDTGLSTTHISSQPAWNASEKIGSPDSRNIYTYNPVLKKVVNFEWGNLSDPQADALNLGPAGLVDDLGEARVAWTRGKPHADLRSRTRTKTKNGKEDATPRLLGDIVNADPVFVGDEQNYGFVQDGYLNYVRAKKGKVEPTVYVNSNDGMLHAFRASDGAEVFAFLPSINYDKLAQRSYTNFSAVGKHKYLLDGQIFVGDFKVGTQWRTILVSAFGGGGKGLFALDITDGFDPQQDFLFELTGDDYQFIGNVMGRPIVSPLKDGSWALIFGNGYNSTSSQSGLVVVGLSDPKKPDVKFLNTGVGGDNGLAEPAISLTAGGTAQFAYGGDLKGNLWRFDLESMGDIQKLYQAKDDVGDEQPITASPVLGLNPLMFKERLDVTDVVTMVYFGTGSYMSNADPLNTALQSFYAIADLGKELDQDDMYEKTYVQNNDTSRLVEKGIEQENQAVDWSDKDGWYLNFKTESGERVVEKPQLTFDRLIFPTVIPSESPCAYGGTSWVMELVGVGQLYNKHSVLGEQGTYSDTLVQLSDVILDEDARDGGTIVKQNSDGTLEPVEVELPAGAFGRQSWRQVR